MLNPSQFADANKATIDQLFGFAGQALQGVEQLATLNVQAVKTSLAEFEAIAMAAVSVTNPAEFVTLQSAALQSFPQKATAYGTQVKDIFTTATAGIQAATQEQVSKAQAKFADAINDTLKSAPGSENAVALTKSAMAAMSDAYETVNKASKQVANALVTQGK